MGAQCTDSLDDWRSAYGPALLKSEGRPVMQCTRISNHRLRREHCGNEKGTSAHSELCGGSWVIDRWEQQCDDRFILFLYIHLNA